MSSIKEVADVAGVSTSTVARVMNNRPGVRPDKIRAVLDAMRKINYTPPPATTRRGPKTKAREGIYTKNIAYLLINMNDAVASSVSSPGSMSRAAGAQGLNLFYVIMDNPSQLPPLISATRVDGVIYQGEEPAGRALEGLAKLPVVRMMTRHSGSVYFDCVAPDNGNMGEQAAVYFKKLGLNKVAITCTSPEYSAFRERLASFRRKATELGMEVFVPDFRSGDGPVLIPVGRVSEIVRQTELCFQLAEKERIGVFALDVPYIHAVGQLRERLPEKVRDNLEFVFGDRFFPEQITLWRGKKPAMFDILVDEINQRAVDQLLWRMRNHAGHYAPNDILIKPKLFTF